MFKLMNKLIFSALSIIIFFFGAANILLSQEDASKMFSTANDDFKNGNYSEAAELYQKILDQGVESADIYFNLGNSFYKLKNYPSAILFYERALRLRPGDDDINFNLRLANLKIIDRIQTVDRFFLLKWFDDFMMLYSSSQWAIFGIIFIWLTFIFLAAFNIIWKTSWKKIILAATVIFLIFGITSYFFSFKQNQFENNHNKAIIFMPSVYVKNSPDPSGTDLFILHDGTKVEVLDTVGEWKKIKLADGNIGWIPQQSIEII